MTGQLRLVEALPSAWEPIDAALREGRSSIDVWINLGRRLGFSLEDIVMRRRQAVRSRA